VGFVLCTLVYILVCAVLWGYTTANQTFRLGNMTNNSATNNYRHISE